MPRPSLAEERRPQILAAALRAIAERGFDSVRLSDVADEAGVAVGTVQHYFATRDELLVEAFLDGNRRSVDAARDAVAGITDPWDRVVALVEHVIALDRWELWLEFWAAAARRPDLRSTMAAAYGEWRAPLVEAIETGIGSGRFSPVVPATEVAAVFIAVTDGFGIQRALGVGWLDVGSVRALVVAALVAQLHPVP